jgi:hypothetical protein
MCMCWKETIYGTGVLEAQTAEDLPAIADYTPRMREGSLVQVEHLSVIALDVRNKDTQGLSVWSGVSGRCEGIKHRPGNLGDMPEL